MNAEDFDKKFNDGSEDIVDDVDVSTMRRINQEQKPINVDFSSWVVASGPPPFSPVGPRYIANGKPTPLSD